MALAARRRDASRVTWYLTSQAFLLTAYATSWGAGLAWPVFFHAVLPLAAIVLSGLIFASIYAATWAQDVYLRGRRARWIEAGDRKRTHVGSATSLAGSTTGTRSWRAVCDARVTGRIG